MGSGKGQSKRVRNVSNPSSINSDDYSKFLIDELQDQLNEINTQITPIPSKESNEYETWSDQRLKAKAIQEEINVKKYNDLNNRIGLLMNKYPEIFNEVKDFKILKENVDKHDAIYNKFSNNGIGRIQLKANDLKTRLISLVYKNNEFSIDDQICITNPDTALTNQKYEQSITFKNTQKLETGNLQEAVDKLNKYVSSLTKNNKYETNQDPIKSDNVKDELFKEIKWSQELRDEIGKLDLSNNDAEFSRLEKPLLNMERNAMASINKLNNQREVINKTKEKRQPLINQYMKDIYSLNFNDPDYDSTVAKIKTTHQEAMKKQDDVEEKERLALKDLRKTANDNFKSLKEFRKEFYSYRDSLYDKLANSKLEELMK